MGVWLLASESKTLPLWTSLFAATWWFWSKPIRNLRLPCALWGWGFSLWCNTTREKEPLPTFGNVLEKLVYHQSSVSLLYTVTPLGSSHLKHLDLESVLWCVYCFQATELREIGYAVPEPGSYAVLFYLHGNCWKLVWAPRFSTADSYFFTNIFFCLIVEIFIHLYSVLFFAFQIVFNHLELLHPLSHHIMELG